MEFLWLVNRKIDLVYIFLISFSYASTLKRNIFFHKYLSKQDSPNIMQLWSFTPLWSVKNNYSLIHFFPHKEQYVKKLIIWQTQIHKKFLTMHILRIFYFLRYIFVIVIFNNFFLCVFKIKKISGVQNNSQLY